MWQMEMKKHHDVEWTNPQKLSQFQQFFRDQVAGFIQILNVVPILSIRVLWHTDAISDIQNSTCNTTKNPVLTQ